MEIKNGLASMLLTNRSAGVVPELNLMYPLHASFKTQSRQYQTLKTGVSLAPKNLKKCIHV